MDLKIYKMMIKEYRKDIKKVTPEEKKREIINLFKNHKIKSTEFTNIKFVIHFAFEHEQYDLIELLLGREVIYNGATYKVNESNKTASFFKLYNQCDFTVPKKIFYESSEYLVTSVINGDSEMFGRSIRFDEESSVRTFYPFSFRGRYIEELFLPESLTELKDGWCQNLNQLKKIVVSPKNRRFVYKDEKFLLGKSDSENDNFDTILFARRDIEEAVIPSNIKIISPYAFFFCLKMKKVEFEENSNLQIIGENSFNLSGIERISIPPSVTKICKGAFGNCENLIEVNIPKNSNLKIIEEQAFYDSKIKEFFIPKNLVDLEQEWCSNSANLASFIISPENNRFLFFDDKFLLGKTDENSSNFDVVLYGIHSIEEAVIPSSIKIIASHAFFHCDKLVKVRFDEDSNLQKIGKCAFSMSGIEEFFVPPPVVKISKRAFYRCKYLKVIEITRNSNIEKIGEYAFSLTSIEQIFIPCKVEKISRSAFELCTNIKTVEIPENSNLKSFEDFAFFKSGIESIFIPENLTELCEKWCFDTKKLTKITLSPKNDRFIFKDEKYLLGKSDCKSNDYDVLLFARRDIKDATIYPNIKIIAPFAFDLCNDLQNVEIPQNSNLEKIGKYSFSCSNIEQICIPPNVVKIGHRAFNFCQNLRRIEIPENSKLQKIGYGAFSFSKIEEFFIPSNVININENIFDICFDLKIIEISDDSKMSQLPNLQLTNCPNVIIMIPKKVKINV